MKILLTGFPGCGKTTVIRRVLENLRRPATGFFTLEIREGGRRVGFYVESLEGRKAVMSHVDIRSRARVGRYGVDLKSFESVALPALDPGDTNTLVVIDEIGKMECFSSRFIERIRLLLAGPNQLLGTVARKGGGFVAEARSHPQVELVEVTSENRDTLPEKLRLKLDYVGNSSAG